MRETQHNLFWNFMFSLLLKIQGKHSIPPSSSLSEGTWQEAEKWLSFSKEKVFSLEVWVSSKVFSSMRSEGHPSFSYQVAFICGDHRSILKVQWDEIYNYARKARMKSTVLEQGVTLLIFPLQYSCFFFFLLHYN